MHCSICCYLSDTDTHSNVKSDKYDLGISSRRLKVDLELRQNIQLFREEVNSCCNDDRNACSVGMGVPPSSISLYPSVRVRSSRHDRNPKLILWRGGRLNRPGNADRPRPTRRPPRTRWTKRRRTGGRAGGPLVRPSAGASSMWLCCVRGGIESSQSPPSLPRPSFSLS